VPCKINVIPFHPIDFTGPKGFAAALRPTRPERMGQFVTKLRDANITVMVRSSSGKDIEAACGQLTVKNKRTKEPRAERAKLSA
jgi:23S rRNA (adenine2503-C2)-methyltransferase